MVKAEAIEKLRAFEPTLRSMGADGLFLFGSTARGDQKSSSDIDVFLEVKPGATFTLLDVAQARRFLTDGLRVPVDLTIREDISARYRDDVMSDAVRVF